MTSPSRPSVAMKAKASGTPAKLEATPLKVMSAGRTQSGSPPRSAASASPRPRRAPSAADAALISRLSANESRIDAEYTYLRGARAEARPLSLYVYTLAELIALLEAAGLELIATYGSREREPFELGAREAILIAEKV